MRFESALCWSWNRRSSDSDPAFARTVDGVYFAQLPYEETSTTRGNDRFWPTVSENMSCDSSAVVGVTEVFGCVARSRACASVAKT